MDFLDSGKKNKATFIRLDTIMNILEHHLVQMLRIHWLYFIRSVCIELNCIVLIVNVTISKMYFTYVMINRCYNDLIDK
jgi:hypothetical protein